MSLEYQFKKILKHEIIGLIILISLIGLLIPFILHFIKTDETVNKIVSMIVIIIIITCLVIILVLKSIIIYNIKWSSKHYLEDSEKVYQFLKKRRATLISLRGHISNYELYNNALKAMENIISDINN